MSENARPDDCDDPAKRSSSVRAPYARYAAISQFTGEVVTTIVLGLLADRYWGIAPWGVILGATLGLAVGLYHLITAVIKPTK